PYLTSSPPHLRRLPSFPTRRSSDLLDEALVEAGIDRDSTYVTNAVKHFKWQARGKRRIHQKPNWTEMTACRPWLQAELEVVKPRSEEHTSELQSRENLVCRLLLEKK